MAYSERATTTGTAAVTVLQLYAISIAWRENYSSAKHILQLHQSNARHRYT